MPRGTWRRASHGRPPPRRRKPPPQKTAALETADQQIETLRLSRTLQLRTLDATYGSKTSSYESSYLVPLTDQERATITASIKVWTADELIFGFSAGLLKPVTDTSTTIEDANIIAGAVIVTVRDNIGKTGGQVTINLQSTLTDDERVMLAAAERKDVNVLTTERITATVNFSSSANSLTRTSGTWGSTFKAGDHIQVEGLTANATGEGSFYKIKSISGATMTFDASAKAVSTLEYLKSVTLSAVARNPLGEVYDASVNISGNTITRYDGGTFAGLVVGDKITLSNMSAATTDIIGEKRPSLNVGTTSTVHTITAISDSVLTLSSTLQAETGIALTIGQKIDILYVQIQQREDFDVTLSGSIKTTSGGDTFLGSEGDVYIDILTIGTSGRVKTSGAIFSTSDDGTARIIVGEDTVLEAGQGQIGTASARLWVNQTSATAELTARARQHLAGGNRRRFADRVGLL